MPRYYYPLWKLTKSGTETVISSSWYKYSGKTKNQGFCCLREHTNYRSLFLTFSHTSTTKMAPIGISHWEKKPGNKEAEFELVFV